MYRWVGDVNPEGSGLEQGFADQGSAEEWLSAFYEDLTAAGVAEVSLYEEDRLVYGPMSLAEA